MIEFTIDEADYLEEIREAVEDGIVSTLQAMDRVLEMVGIETVAYLRGYTNERRPPVRRGEPERRAHPGGWSDVTENLALAYDYEVTVTPDHVELAILNTMEYAAILEARDGFFVVRDVTDPGGPVEQALQRAVNVVAPDWRLE